MVFCSEGVVLVILSVGAIERRAVGWWRGHSYLVFLEKAELLTPLELASLAMRAALYRVSHRRHGCVWAYLLLCVWIPGWKVDCGGRIDD